MNLTLSRVMLEDVGLIDKAECTLGSGLTVFTGETGSGKTMVIGGLGLGFGERASADIVRTGAARARVTLEFSVDEEARSAFEQAGFALDPGEDALFEREILATGKSQARCNGRSATASQVRELFSRFVERVGQHDQQRLLDPREHLGLVDRYGGAPVLALRERVATSYAALVELERRRRALQSEHERGNTDRVEAQSALDLIESTALVPNEDVTLRERRERLQHAEKIARSLQNVHEVLTDDDDAAISQIGRSVQSLREIERFDREYGNLAARLLSMQDEISEVARAIGRDLGDDDTHAHELEAIDTRLEKIERLKRRFGGTLASVEVAAAAFRETLMSQSEHEHLARECAESCRVAAERLDADAAALTAARHAVAGRLQAQVREELAALAMGATRFEVRLAPHERIAATGAEHIEFLLAPMPTAALRSLSKIASGGELSRILLALTVVLAGDAGASIMIFDEIDAGIGGVTATAVGERLYRLARSVQVLCVTHLAQLAAFGNAHFTVEKSTSGNEPRIALRELREREEVVVEIARMLSGSNTEVARKHASDLLARRPAIAS